MNDLDFGINSNTVEKGSEIEPKESDMTLIHNPFLIKNWR